MILVDSSVWIDLLQSAHSTHGNHLSELIHQAEPLGVPGPVIQEVLQGIREEHSVGLVQKRLCCFPILHPDTETYVMAARLYRQLARHGTTVPPGDVTIAALVIQRKHELYTLDRRHFERIKQHSELRLYQPSSER